MYLSLCPVGVSNSMTEGVEKGTKIVTNVFQGMNNRFANFRLQEYNVKITGCHELAQNDAHSTYMFTYCFDH